MAPRHWPGRTPQTLLTILLVALAAAGLVMDAGRCASSASAHSTTSDHHGHPAVGVSPTTEEADASLPSGPVRSERCPHPVTAAMAMPCRFVTEVISPPAQLAYRQTDGGESSGSRWPCQSTHPFVPLTTAGATLSVLRI